jgi:aminomethyltransferase
MGVAVNSGLDVTVSEPDVSPLQLQGPKSPLVARDLFGDWAVEMKYYWLRETVLDGIPLVVSRTGWSGELGYELYLRDSQYGDELWERVMAAGQPYKIAPTAPSTIRSIEGGLLSYVSDITLADNPYVIGMGRFVDFDQPGEFVGKAALQAINAGGAKRRLVGIEIEGDTLPSPNEEFWDINVDGSKVGHVTRCAHSPRLDRNIGWANVAVEFSNPGTRLSVASPTGNRQAVVCEAPWFKPHTKIPDELKA